MVREAELERLIEETQRLRDALRNPDGATIIDFYDMWLNQERAATTELQADIAALLVMVDYYQGFAVTAYIRAGKDDMRVGAPPEVLQAGKRVEAIRKRVAP